MNTILTGGNPDVDPETPKVEDTQVIETTEAPVQKKSRPKRAAKKAVKAIAKAVSTAWNVGKQMELHGCSIAGLGKEVSKGNPYRSYWAAWQAAEMGGSRGRHIKARGLLKKQLAETGNPSHTLTRADGKKVTFTLVKSTPES